MNIDSSEGVTPSLDVEHQQLTRARVLAAAREVTARRGFDATVDEIAQEAGVSPRTVFRLYVSHDKLMAEVVKDMFAACGMRPIEGLPTPAQDLPGWIEGLALTIHTRNAQIIGRAFWDIHGPRVDASDEFAEIRTLRRQLRIEGIKYLVTLAWNAAGGRSEPPQDLIWAFALHFSTFTTHALMIDFDLSPQDVAGVTSSTLQALLTKAVDSQAPNAAGV